MDAWRRRHIYAICDQTTGDVMYVGQARNIRARYLAHKKTRSPISDWIIQQESVGVVPVVVILCTIVIPRNGDYRASGIACDAAELALIRHYHRCQKTEILNVVGKPSMPKSRWVLDREPDGMLPCGNVVDVGYGLPTIQYVDRFSRIPEPTCVEQEEDDADLFSQLELWSK
jgi:hypothetical protein